MPISSAVVRRPGPRGATGGVVEVEPARRGDGAAERERGAARRVLLGVVVDLDDLGVERVIEQPRRPRHEVGQDGDADADVGGDHRAGARGQRRQLLALPGVEAGGADDERQRGAPPRRAACCDGGVGAPVKSIDDVRAACRRPSRSPSMATPSGGAAGGDAGVLPEAGWPGASIAPAHAQRRVVARQAR